MDAAQATIRVRVLVFASLAEILGERSRELDLPAGSTVLDAFRRLISEQPALARHLDHISYARNEEFVPAGTVLGHGDELAFIPPVSGGA